MLAVAYLWYWITSHLRKDGEGRVDSKNVFESPANASNSGSVQADYLIDNKSEKLVSDVFDRHLTNGDRNSKQEVMCNTDLLSTASCLSPSPAGDAKTPSSLVFGQRMMDSSESRVASSDLSGKEVNSKTVYSQQWPLSRTEEKGQAESKLLLSELGDNSVDGTPLFSGDGAPQSSVDGALQSVWKPSLHTSHDNEEHSVGGPKFLPPVYIQRYTLVQKILQERAIQSV
jgi:hypothetical protein